MRLDSAFGFDLSDRSIKVVEVKKMWKSKVVAYGEVDLEPGILENGKILKREDLVKKVIDVLASATPQKVSTNRVILSLPESKVFIHYFELPKKLEGHYLEEAIQREIASIVPLAADKLYSDWQIVPAGFGDSTNEMCGVLYAAAEKDFVDELILLLSELGLEIIALDIESASLGRVLLGSEQVPQMILAMGIRHSLVSIFDAQGTLNLSVSIPVAREHFDELIKTTSPAMLEKMDMANLLTLLTPAVESLMGEIRKALEYYEKRYHTKVGKIILADGSALLLGVFDYIGSQLQIQAEVGNPLDKVTWGDAVKNVANPMLFANALSLAIRGTNRTPLGVDLLKRVSRGKFPISHGFDLLTMGHLKKSTLIRSLINNNRPFILTFVFVTLLVFGIVFYAYLYVPIHSIL